jgi:formate dehydrogenase subunit delta
MNIEHLITMANQIGTFFSAYPDRELAKNEIVSHIKRFWAHNMRQQLVTHVNDKQGQGLDAIVTDAVRQHVGQLV